MIKRFGSSNIIGNASPRLVIGLLLIGLGAVFLASNLGLIEDQRPLRFFWPLAFLSLGVTLLTDRSETSRRYWAWIFIGIGVWGFAHRLGWISVGVMSVIVPGILLLVGARLVSRSLRPQDSADAQQRSRLFACMSGHETRSVVSPFKEAEATAVMGGIKMDFHNVTMDGDQATLDVTIIMGGIDLYVPPDWNVNIQALPLLGAAIDKRRPSNVVPTKTLTIRGTILMGGLEVKS
jgi:predicted membrane protein